MASPAPAPTGRLVGIQSLRGVAVLLVVMVHLHHTELKYSQGPHLLGAWNSIGISAVDIFLVVSGFVLTYLAFGHFGRAGYAKTYAYARISRVYPLYMLLTALLIPLYLWQPTHFNAAEENQVNLLRSLLLVPDVRLPLIPVAWTLHQELYFYVVFGAMLLLPERFLPKAMLVWLLVSAALVGWGAFIPRDEQGAFERVFFNAINFEFILGMAAAWAVARGPRLGARACLWLAAVWVVLAFALWLVLTDEYWVSDFWRVWVYGVPAALFVYGIVCLELQGRGVFWPRLAWIGDGAYSIYLTHLMVLVAAGRVWVWLGMSGWLPHLFFLTGSVAVALAVGYAIFLYIEQPMLRWSRRHDPTRPRRSVKPVVSA